MCECNRANGRKKKRLRENVCRIGCLGGEREEREKERQRKGRSFALSPRNDGMATRQTHNPLPVHLPIDLSLSLSRLFSLARSRPQPPHDTPRNERGGEGDRSQASPVLLANRHTYIHTNTHAYTRILSLSLSLSMDAAANRSSSGQHPSGGEQTAAVTLGVGRTEEKAHADVGAGVGGGGEETPRTSDTAAPRRGGLRRKAPMAAEATQGDAVLSPATSAGRGEQRDVVSSAQLECLAAVAYLLGSPLQRRQPSAQEGAVQPSLLLAYELLDRGVDPERVVELVEARSSFR